MTIFAFPYAGGSSLIYSNLKKILMKEVNFIPMEYPGHGIRIEEELLKSMDELVDDAYQQLIEKDNGDEFVLIGYSLGSSVVYELYRKIKNKAISKRLKCVIFCASTPPDVYDEKIDIKNMNNKELLDYAINLGGSRINGKDEFEAYKFFLPMIREDILIYQNYKRNFNRKQHCMIDKPVFVFYSSYEKSIENYKKYCSNICEFKMFNGGHFFINNDWHELSEAIKISIK